MRYLWTVALFLCLQTGVSVAAEAAWAGEARVNLSSDGAVADVELELEWAGEDACPDHVFAEMTADGFPGGYLAHVRFADDTSPAGAGDGGLVFQLASAPSLVIRYRVLLDHDPTDWGSGADESPRRFAGGAMWTLRALLLRIHGATFRVSFSAGDGLQLLAPKFDDPLAAPDGLLVVHRPGEGRSVSLDERRRVFVTHAAREHAARLIEGLRTFAAAGDEAFGARRRDHSLVCIDVHDEPWAFDGGMIGGDVSVLVGSHLLISEPWVGLRGLGHELLHDWLSVSGESREELLWLQEGGAEYFSLLMGVKHGLLSRKRWFDELESAVEQYLNSGARGLRADPELWFDEYRARAYAGGMVAALVADVEIRSQPDTDLTLASVLRTHLESAGPMPSWSTDDFDKAVISAVGSRLSERFADLAEGNGLDAVHWAFARLGWELHVEKDPLPTLNWAVHHFLGVGSATVTDEGIELRRVRVESVEEGDVLAELDGEPCRDFDELRVIAAKPLPGRPLDAVVWRGTERRTIQIPVCASTEFVPQWSYDARITPAAGRSRTEPLVELLK